MGLETLNPAGLKPFTGKEAEAHVFFLNLNAKLIAADIDTAVINQPPSSSTSTAVTSSSSSSSASTGRATTRARQRTRNQRRRAAITATDDDDDDDDDDDATTHASAASSSSTAAATRSTPRAGHLQPLLNPHEPRVDAAIFSFLVSVLGGHPLQLATTDNAGSSGCLALRRLKQRYIRSGVDYTRRLKKELTTISWRADDSVDSFMNRLSDLNTRLLAAGVATPEDDLRSLVRNALPADFDLAMRFLEREEPPPSISRLTAELIEEERRLGRTKQTSVLAAVEQRAGQPAAPDQVFNGGRRPCCPPRNKLHCAFCDVPRHCAQECRKLAAAKQRGLISKLHAGMRGDAKRNGQQRGSFNSTNARKRASFHQGPSAGPRTATFAVDHHEALAVKESHRDASTEPVEHMWLADSGATAHITNDASLLQDYVTTKQAVKVANNETTDVIGKGTAVLHVTSTDGKRGTIVLRNVLHVPAISYNLLALNLVAKASKDAHVVVG